MRSKFFPFSKWIPSRCSSSWLVLSSVHSLTSVSYWLLTVNGDVLLLAFLARYHTSTGTSVHDKCLCMCVCWAEGGGVVYSRWQNARYSWIIVLLINFSLNFLHLALVALHKPLLPEFAAIGLWTDGALCALCAIFNPIIFSICRFNHFERACTFAVNWDANCSVSSAE